MRCYSTVDGLSVGQVSLSQGGAFYPAEVMTFLPVLMPETILSHLLIDQSRSSSLTDLSSLCSWKFHQQRAAGQHFHSLFWTITTSNRELPSLSLSSSD